MTRRHSALDDRHPYDDAAHIVTTDQQDVDSNTKHRPLTIPINTQLECWACRQATEHRFETYESIPDLEWPGQPIWTCQRCGAPHYGPTPE